jgi:serine/threonine protein phosphatase PrpC
MKNSAATINCPNPRCLAPNPLSHNFCQKCRTPLPKRYLRAVGEGIDAYQTGDILADRYWLKGSRILLDTKPGLPPEAVDEIPEEILPYLKLSPYQLHIPQVYGLLMPTQERWTGRRTASNQEIWLLEQVPIYSGGAGTSLEGQLMPELIRAWKIAPPLRQLNWLWQMAQLWQPMSKEKVASSLLTPGFLRVEGSLVRLLDLQLDEGTAPTLEQLGQLWSQWIPEAQPAVANFLEQLCQQLDAGQIRTSEQLVELLDQGLAECGRSQSSTYQIATFSDTGPSRRRNEDACYPPGGTVITPTNKMGLAIVCDGIGGHEGGDVASNLAIEAIRQRVENISLTPSDPTTLTLALEESACVANDLISDRNDDEQRHERQRMGTTLVMALANNHEIYITHVGDSRAYRVTRTGCHQVTLDDDLASREVRLGYALYRDAVQQPTSGSLVQALGMSPSAMLHPTVQRFIVDEDCVFLLCSDGLSDNDRVEQYWDTEILPVLEGQVDLVTASKRLIQLGNTQNGHDNVTVGLVYCQVKQPETGQPEVAVAQMDAISAPPQSQAQATLIPDEASQKVESSRLGRGPWALLGILLLMGLAGGLAYGFVSGSFTGLNIPSINSDSGTTDPPDTQEAPPTSPSPASESSLEKGSLIQIQSSTTKNSKDEAVPLLLKAGFDSTAVIGLIPANSVLGAIAKQTTPKQESWVQLKVCSTPSAINSQAPVSQPDGTRSQTWQSPATSKPVGAGSKTTATATYRLVEQGQVGWIREAEIVPVRGANLTPNSPNVGVCAIPPVSGSPTSTPAPSPNSSQ